MKLKIGLTTLISLIFLLGCAQEQVVVPGKREPISAVDSTAKLDNVFGSIENGSRRFPISNAKANVSWTQGHGTQITRTSHPSLDIPIDLLWSVSIGKGDQARHRITAEPVVFDGKIFTVDSLMVLSATTKDGKILWQKDLTPDGESSGEVSGAGLAAGAGKIFVTTGSAVMR